MKQILHIITDDPRQQNRFKSLELPPNESLVVLPLLGTTEEGRVDYNKSKWYFKITIENDGEVSVDKEYE